MKTKQTSKQADVYPGCHLLVSCSFSQTRVPALYQVKFQFQIFALTIEIWHSCPSLSPPHLIRSISTLGEFHTERVLVGGRDHLPPLKKKPTFPNILARAHSMMLRSHHSGDHMSGSTQDVVTQRSWNYAGCIWQGCGEWESHHLQLSGASVMPVLSTGSMPSTRGSLCEQGHCAPAGPKAPLWDLAWSGHWILSPWSHIYIVLYV